MKSGAAGARFHRAEPRPGAPEGPAPYLALFAGESDLAARELEARWLARQVAQALATLKERETIGILLFTRTHLPRYLQALYDAGLAVRVREGLKLAESRSVAHLHNLARALTRPQDEVAWAAVLRGPWGPQPLAALARVAQIPGDLWPEKLRRFAGQADCPAELAGAGRVPGKSPGPGGAAAPGRHPDRLARGHRRLGRDRRLGRPPGSGQRPDLPGPPGRGGSGAPRSHLRQGRLQPPGGFSAAGPPGPGLPGGDPDGARRQRAGVSPGVSPLSGLAALEERRQDPALSPGGDSRPRAVTAWPWPGPISRKNRAPFTCCSGT